MKSSSSGTDAGRLELERHRPQLLKFALLQLRDREQAEDAVQETLVAALQGAAQFQGASAVRTWLTGILKHKIIDQIRRNSRERPLGSLAKETSTDEFDALFQPDGHYAVEPADWGDPEAALTQRRFFEVLEACMEGLPKNTARVFALREVMGMGTDEICQETGISATHCWVLLYRARMSLRACLEQRWFGTAR